MNYTTLGKRFQREREREREKERETYFQRDKLT
jgi:hypothetical protein